MSASPESRWFWDHYDGAAAQIVDFFAGDGIDLRGKDVADVGCGDGITDLGLFRRAEPATLTGFDIDATDLDYLAAAAAR